MKCVLTFIAACAVGASCAHGETVTGATPLDPSLHDRLHANMLDDASAVYWLSEFEGQLRQDLMIDDGVVRADTKVMVLQFYWDPETPSVFRGSLLFDFDILGLITSSEMLAATDELVGDPSMVYESFTYRGLEGRDRTTIVGRRTLELDLRASSPGDFFRVVLATPTPGTAAMGLLGAAMLGRRRRN